MITVKIFGNMRRKTQVREITFDGAHSVADLLVLLENELNRRLAEQSSPVQKEADADSVREKKGRAQAEPVTSAQLRQCVIFVNDTPIDKLRLFKTPLADGDTVSLLSQAAGG